MSGHEWEIAILLVGAVATAVIGGLVTAIFRRAEKTGERLGRIEKWYDFERGRRAGMREKARKGLER
jgi:hypothetical protein